MIGLSALPRISFTNGGNSHNKTNSADACHFPVSGMLRSDIQKIKSLSKASLSGDKRSERPEFPASLTVEAALSVTIFLCLASLFFTFYKGQLLEIRLQRELDKISGAIAEWSYLLAFSEEYTGMSLTEMTEKGLLAQALEGRPEAVEELISEESDILKEVGRFLVEKGSAAVWQELVRAWFLKDVGDIIEESGIVKGGCDGISLSGSSLYERNIDLVIRYEVRSAVRFPAGLSYPVVQRSCRRLWIGTKGSIPSAEEEPEEEQVYVTSSGEVFHRTLSCRILHITVREEDAAALSGLRNTDGGKYYPCEYCLNGKKVKTGTVYLTDSGERYHASPECSRIARNVFALPFSEAEKKYRPCFYCGTAGSGR